MSDAQMWSSANGYSTLGYLGTGNWAEAVAVNNLGQVVVGTAGSSPSDLMGEAFL